MNSMTAQNADPEANVEVEPNVRDPIYSWLKRELQAQYSNPGREALPPRIAELAARLEEKLRGSERAPAKDDEAPGEDPGS